MEIFFKVLAVILLGVAAVLFWQNNSEWTFAAAVLAACAYFLGMRFQLKARMDKRKAEAEEETKARAEEDSPAD